MPPGMTPCESRVLPVNEPITPGMQAAPLSASNKPPQRSPSLCRHSSAPYRMEGMPRMPHANPLKKRWSNLTGFAGSGAEAHLPQRQVGGRGATSPASARASPARDRPPS